MKSLSARPENIQTIFGSQKHYIIPEFQRPYSWTKDEAIKLFEDITDFFMEHREESTIEVTYYLGNIVYYPEGDSFVVIDGQQRLTTLTLFLNALFSISTTYTALQRCLKREDPVTSDPIPEIKIDTRVISKDKEELNGIILNNNIENKGNLTTNYKEFVQLLSEWKNNHNLSAEEMNKFIQCVLRNVLLLPILCEDADDALTIFDTLNNRGLQLSDASIFKAQIYKKIQDANEKNTFIHEWNKINIEDDIDELFRFLMHIERAKNNDISKEIGLRKYFEKSILFTDWRQVIDSLWIIHDPIMVYDDSCQIKSKLDCLWGSLAFLPHVYCHYPIYVYWAKHAKLDNGYSTLPLNKIQDFEELLLRTIKYYYFNAISTNTANTIKDTTFKVCAAIWQETDYLQFYSEKHDKVFDVFKTKFLNYDYGKTRKGLAYLLAVLNQQQNFDEFTNIKKLDLEHILPQHGYNNYNGWTLEQYAEKINSLGNLVIIEKKLNIKASNEFFNKKKQHYLKSKITEVLALCDFADWTYEEWKKRQLIIDNFFLEFFKEIK